jgi:sugar lactone lactonase YvrE
VWVVVKDQLDNGAENFKTSDCFAVDLSVASCTYDSTNVAVLIKKGSNQIEISNAKLIFEDQGSTSIIEINNTLPQPLGARQFVFARTQVPNPSTVTIAAILGGVLVCSPSSEKVTCTTSPNAIVNNNSNNANNTASTSWNKLNGGNPIDEGRSIAYFDYIPTTNQVTTIKDSSGNLLYSFRGGGPNYLYLGRLSTTKSWDVLTYNGWSRSITDVPKPLSLNRFIITNIKMFNSFNQNTIIGTFAAAPGFSNNRLDIHDRAYSFSFNGQDPSYWSVDDGYNNNSVTSLTSSIFGIPGYGHDADKNNNSLLSVSVTSQGNRVLTAARYKNGIWQSWLNNGWAQPTNFVYSDANLHVPALPFSKHSNGTIDPIVTAIPGTQEFIVTFYSSNSQTYTTSLKAAKYNDASGLWSWWNNGWQTDTSIAPQALTSEFSGSEPEHKEAFVQDDMLYVLYTRHGSFFQTLSTLSFNLTSQTWGIETAQFEANSFALGKNESGAVWITYANRTNVLLSSFSRGGFSTPEKVYSSGASAGVRVMGLAFTNSNPIIFIGEGLSSSVRLYALGNTGGGYWNDEQIRALPSSSQPVLLTQGVEKGQFETKVMENISYNGNYYPLESPYSSQLCGHMAFDSENNLYCPKTIVNGVSIFPPNYTPSYYAVNETAHHWGGWWDYFYFPSSVAVDNIRGKVYITDNIAEGNELDGISTGNLQVWEKSWNDENVIRDIQNGSNNPIVVVNPLPWIPKVYTEAEAGHNLNWPSDVAINEQRALLYLTETNANRVVVYNVSTGTPIFLKTFGSEGSAPGQLNHPEGIDIDEVGNVYVVDSRNSRVGKFDYDGNLITQWGSLGSGNNQFIYPYALAVDKIKGYVYVTDPGNNRIQIFNQSGQFVGVFGQWTPQLPSTSSSAFKLDKMGGIVANNNSLFVSTNNNNSLDASPGVVVKFQMSLP